MGAIGIEHIQRTLYTTSYNVRTPRAMCSSGLTWKQRAARFPFQNPAVWCHLSYLSTKRSSARPILYSVVPAP